MTRVLIEWGYGTWVEGNVLAQTDDKYKVAWDLAGFPRSKQLVLGVLMPEWIDKTQVEVVRKEER